MCTCGRRSPKQLYASSVSPRRPRSKATTSISRRIDITSWSVRHRARRLRLAELEFCEGLMRFLTLRWISSGPNKFPSPARGLVGGGGAGSAEGGHYERDQQLRCGACSHPGVDTVRTHWLCGCILWRSPNLCQPKRATNAANTTSSSTSSAPRRGQCQTLTPCRLARTCRVCPHTTG